MTARIILRAHPWTATNPASAVRGPKHVVKKGKTPVLALRRPSHVREDLPDHGRIVQRADQAQPAPAIGTRQNINCERPVHESRPAPGARTAPQAPGALLQPRVAGHGHDVLDLLPLEPREQLGVGKASIQPHAAGGRRKGRAQLREHAPQDPRAPRVAGALPGRNAAATAYCAASSAFASAN